MQRVWEVPLSSAADLQVRLSITDHLPMSLLYVLCPFRLVVDFDGNFGGFVELSCHLVHHLVKDPFRGLCLATCHKPTSTELRSSFPIVACWVHVFCLERQAGALAA